MVWNLDAYFCKLPKSLRAISSKLSDGGVEGCAPEDGLYRSSGIGRWGHYEP